ncbi:type I restriction endonuclease [Stenotrophomonas oahuensis]|uniref:type I site-specific deoxyribonuclease n=1 Tax=Stenotrophomonas oahuensis TaxID=3003271 RepID=A0ABY9YS83_9GAMM|nr:type I restriction endonuclease [Stenotrophomonas sp. A5586]WNH53799.1 type I restriction endonuclease [Stenotrophomonas sp. A5586]
MKGPRHEDAVRRSALAWLKRLGWNHLSFEQYRALTGHPDNVLLADRVRAILQRFRYVHEGRPLPLPEDKVDAILRQLADTHPGAPWPVASARALHMLHTGISVELSLPDGGRITHTLPLIDWAHPNRNHWDVADDLRGCGYSRADGIRDLVCFVNGIPLVVIACVERDSHRHWGHMQQGAHHLLQCLQPSALDPLPRQAQLLISLDRRGGAYAGAGTPGHAWTRWREDGWSAAAVAQRRNLPVVQYEGPPDVPLATHAEVICGVLSHARLLRLLHRYIQSSPPVQPKLARAAQFFAVEAALCHLRRVVRYGRNSDAQVCLAPGCGLQRAREWLAAAMLADLGDGAFRLLMPVQHPSRTLPAWVRGQRVPDPPAGARQLRAFFEGHQPSPLQVSVQVLLRWADSAHSATSSGRGVVLLLDAGFWTQPGASLAHLRGRLPEATWLTFAPVPIKAGVGCPHPGTIIYQYREHQAIADGVVVPVLQGRREDADLLQDAGAGPIARHFQSRTIDLQRDLRGTVLVDTVAQADQLQHAFMEDGRLNTQVKHLDARGHCRERMPAMPPADVQLEICSGSLPALQEARLGIAYVERALSAIEHARLLGLINQPHPDKHAALLVLGHAAAAHLRAADTASRLPKSTRPDPLARLSALVPDASTQDFSACVERVIPRWEVTSMGEDRDAHRQRRHLLRRRVTDRGLALQLAAPAGQDRDDAEVDQARCELRFYAQVDEFAAVVALEDADYSREDRRVRHWLRGGALEVREAPGAYAAATEDVHILQRAGRAYAELRAHLEHPGEEPGRVEPARRELQGVLRDHPGAAGQVTALEQFRARLPALLGHAGPLRRSRSHLLLEGMLGTGMGVEGHAPLARLIEATVRSGFPLLPDEPLQFRQHLRASLRGVLEREFGAMRAELILDALISRAPHWIGPGYGMTGGT